jgi:hypothetical protein
MFFIYVYMISRENDLYSRLQAIACHYRFTERYLLFFIFKLLSTVGIKLGNLFMCLISRKGNLIPIANFN